jgi:hypothetical protein
MITHETEIHPVATMFPMMSDAELAELADDIRENGLREAIWTYDGKVVDGRNRLKACQIAGVEPKFREWKGDGSLVKFIVSLNSHRRHLSPGQRAAVAVEIEKHLAVEIAEEKRAKCSDAGRSGGRPSLSGSNQEKGSRTNARTLSDDSAPRLAGKEAAEEAGVSPRLVASAKQIAKTSPEVFEKVKSGQQTIPEAKRELGLTPPKPTGKCRVNGELVDDPPDIAKRRAAGKIPANVVPVIDDPDEKTSFADIQEEYVERAAIQDDLSDEDWIKTLPLSRQLQGKPLEIFKDHAVLWRTIDPYRRAFADGIAPFIKKPRKRIGLVYRLNAFIGIDHPKRWRICPPLTEGGCGGAGDIPVIGGDCPKCWSAGFLLK